MQRPLCRCARGSVRIVCILFGGPSLYIHPPLAWLADDGQSQRPSTHRDDDDDDDDDEELLVSAPAGVGTLMSRCCRRPADDDCGVMGRACVRASESDWGAAGKGPAARLTSRLAASGSISMQARRLDERAGPAAGGDVLGGLAAAGGGKL